MKPRIIKYNGPAATNSYCALLTKEVVDTLLDINTNNRKPKNGNLSMFDSIIKNNDWDVGAAVIRVNMSWTRLIDGQHKLMKLKENGYPVVAATIIEVPDEYTERTFLNTDIGCIRTVAQAMQLGGAAFDTKFWAAVERAYKCVATDIRYKCTSASVNRFHEKYKDIVSASCVTSSKKFGNAAAVAALIVFCENEPDLADEAIKGYKEADDGIMLTQEDARYHLNRFLYGSHGNNKNQIFFKVLKAIWLYTHRQRTLILRIEDKDVEMFSTRYNLCVKQLINRSTSLLK